MLLTDLLQRHRGPLATACLSVPADGVSNLGWDELNADLTAIAGGAEHVVTAVGLDLSGHGDSDTGDWWDKEPAIEVAYSTDSPFAFSTATLEELLAVSELSLAYVRVTGLRGVYGSLLTHEDEHGPDVATRVADRAESRSASWRSAPG